MSLSKFKCPAALDLACKMDHNSCYNSCFEKKFFCLMRSSMCCRSLLAFIWMCNFVQKKSYGYTSGGHIITYINLLWIGSSQSLVDCTYGTQKVNILKNSTSPCSIDLTYAQTQNVDGGMSRGLDYKAICPVRLHVTRYRNSNCMSYCIHWTFRNIPQCIYTR